MIKKLAVAVTFAASSLIVVPTANASSGVCMMQYQENLAACNGDTTCEMWADIVFTQCLQDQYAGIDPEP